MRGNPVKDALARGETVFGTMVFEFASPGLPAILAGAGARFALYDMEHSGLTDDEIKRQVAYCRGLDIVPLVRPPDKTYAATARLLDIGVMGLMYQMVESAGEAAELASYCRYPPGGVRGAMFSGAHDDYAGGDVTEKMAAADERTLVMALIETAKGVENADAIMAVPGVDMAHVGHFDLSLTMGIPGQFDHPDFPGGDRCDPRRLRQARQARRLSCAECGVGARVAGARLSFRGLQHRYPAARRRAAERHRRAQGRGGVAVNAARMPLADIRVLDLTRARAGPTAVRHLADWGADVVKIEAPSEPDGEGLGGARAGPDYLNLHRNKRAMTLNLNRRAAARYS